MDDVKDKFKGFMKKVNNQFSSSSSGKFKGQGRVLGSSSSGPVNPISSRHSQPQTLNSKPNPSSSSSSSITSNSNPLLQKPLNPDQSRRTPVNNPEPNRNPTNGFDAYDSLITSAKRSQNGYSLNVFECPICGSSYRSEEELSVHVESCLNNSVENNGAHSASGLPDRGTQNESKLEICIGQFVSAKPPEVSVDVVLRLLRNIIREPENAKFRKIRMSNTKIREAVGEIAGGIELLEIVGFVLKEEGGEMWAMMEVPGEEQISLINKAIALLEPRKMDEPKVVENLPSAAPAETGEAVEAKKVDRQIRVFFSVPESVAAKIQLPDSFYNLSAEELKREADMRKKKIEESQLLIPKSYKEKQAKAARKRYIKSIIRVQFPDGVVLQGVFSPWEPTTALYEFVSSALKEPSLQFELLDPVLVKRRVIPHFPEAGQKAKTLEEVDLVPSALVKFRPIETDSVVFTGLSNELLEISEPLSN